jgi:hypothetical protein
MSPAASARHERRRFSLFKCCPTSRIGWYRSSEPRPLCGRLNCLLPQRYQRLCVAAVCALPARRHKFKQSAPQTTTNVTSPEDAYHASRRRSDRIRLPPGCRSDRSHDYPFGFFLQGCDVLSASKAVRCARKETSIFPHQIGAGRIDRADFQDWCLKPLGHLSGSHSIASRTHPLQALRSGRLLPQESLKISMRCSPFAKTLDWLGGRSAVS